MRNVVFLVVTLAANPAFADDQVANGTFDAGLENWWTTPNLTATITDGQLCADVPGGTTNPWDAILGQDKVVLETGENYAFTFTASGAPKGAIRALVQMNTDPWDAYAEVIAQVTETAGGFEASFTSQIDNPEAQVVFQLGGQVEPWRLCMDEVHLIGGAEVKTYQPDTGPLLRVNQLGYLASGPKRATLVNDSAAPVSFAVQQADGQVIFEGESQPLGLDTASGLALHLLDFGVVFETGDGFMLGAGDAQSYPFSIKDDLYAGLLGDALQYFYPVRSGIEIRGDLAGDAYARPAGHLGVAPNTGDTAVPCQAPDSSLKAYGEAWTCGYTLDVAGGWYDAGDHGKYVVNGGISVAQLMAAYERAPDLFTDGGMKIPEAGNGVPDILDEARWEIDFMLKMVVPEGEPLAGMVHHKVHDSEWTGLPLLPHLDDKTRELHRPSTAATLNLAAAAAQGARLFRPFDEGYADQLLAAARAAYAAAKATPDLYATPEDGTSGGGPYDDTVLTDEFFWAAAELYLTTEEPAWLDELVAIDLGPEQRPGTKGFDWKSTAPVAYLQLVTVKSNLPDSVRGPMQAEVIAAADALVAGQGARGWGENYGPEDGIYDWGSNHLHLQNAIIVATAYDLTEDAKYRTSVLETMDYIFGRNALNISYVTGYGTFFAQNQHSRWFAAQKTPDLPHPPKGALAGGPNSVLADPTAETLLTGCVAQFCYVDDIDSWSTNEITINWNAALVQIAAVLKGY
jgi:endoglucanase